MLLDINFPERNNTRTYTIMDAHLQTGKVAINNLFDTRKYQEEWRERKIEDLLNKQSAATTNEEKTRYSLIIRKLENEPYNDFDGAEEYNYTVKNHLLSSIIEPEKYGSAAYQGLWFDKCLSQFEFLFQSQSNKDEILGKEIEKVKLFLEQNSIYKNSDFAKRYLSVFEIERIIHIEEVSKYDQYLENHGTDRLKEDILRVKEALRKEGKYLTFKELFDEILSKGGLEENDRNFPLMYLTFEEWLNDRSGSIDDHSWLTKENFLQFYKNYRSTKALRAKDMGEEQQSWEVVQKEQKTIEKIEWLGTQKELAELFVEQKKKGWVAGFSYSAIKACYTNSHTIEQSLKPTKQNNKASSEETYDGIFTKKYVPKFYGIKYNTKMIIEEQE